MESKERINQSKSVFVGDHVWLGQSSMLLKGTQIGSGSIIGAGSVVAGKQIPSNTAWAGNPVRKVKSGVFWSGQCVHRWKDKETKDFWSMQTDRFIFKEGHEGNYCFDILERKLSAYKTADSKMKYLTEVEFINDKNRFSVV